VNFDNVDDGMICTNFDDKKPLPLSSFKPRVLGEEAVSSSPLAE
jgi:hypothetical protein